MLSNFKLIAANDLSRDYDVDGEVREFYYKLWDELNN